VSEHNKAIVRRLIAEVLNGGHLEVIDELYTPELARAAKGWIAPFRASFPDVHMEIVELIAEGDCIESRNHQFAKLIKDSRAMSNSRPAYYFTLTVAGGVVHRIQEDKTFNAC
jgi:hypothetical protein